MTFEGHRLAVSSNEEYSVSQLRWMLREVEDILERRVGLSEWEEP